MQQAFSSHFMHPKHQPLLQQHQLATFEALWQYQGDWFEPPNHERGGWSGVNYIELRDESGELHGFYLKRQQGHMRKTWQHPFAGEPTFVREFNILQCIENHNKAHCLNAVGTPELVFFAEQQQQSILLTKALTGFISADAWLKNNASAPIKKKRALVQKMAECVANLHLAGVQHRSLYLKHIFVKENEAQVEVALIDFEKSRKSIFIGFFKWMDLIKLHQRAQKVTRTNKLYFFKHYCQRSVLSRWQQCLIRCLL